MPFIFYKKFIVQKTKSTYGQRSGGILPYLAALERKEVFENSKQHFYPYVDYMFMSLNRLDLKDAIFVVVAL